MKCIVFKKREKVEGSGERHIDRGIPMVESFSLSRNVETRNSVHPTVTNFSRLRCDRYIVRDRKVLYKFLDKIKKIQKKGQIVELALMVEYSTSTHPIIDMRYFRKRKDAANWEGQYKYKILYGNSEKILKKHCKLFEEWYLHERLIPINNKYLIIYRKLIALPSTSS